MMNSGSALLLLSILAAATRAQQSYKTPPKEILEVLEAPETPSVSIDPTRRWMLLVDRVDLPPIADLAQPMLRLAGVRVNPAIGSLHALRRYDGLSLQDLTSLERQRVALPDDPDVGFPSWSPDGRHFAFTITTGEGVELWIGDTESAAARRLLPAIVNGVERRTFQWLPGGEALLVQVIPSDRGPMPAAPAVPSGPVIQENLGTRAPVRTYQDLLGSPYDEALFDHFFTSELVRVSTAGEVTNVGPPAIYGEVDPSPDGRFLLISRIVRPYSYLVTMGSFPEVYEVWDRDGGKVAPLHELPLRDATPLGGVPVGPRSIGWQSSAAAQLVWVEALDGGDPEVEAERRDQVCLLPAPFRGEKTVLGALEHRYAGIEWTSEPAQAFVREYDRDRRWTRTWLWDLGGASEPRLLFDRSVRDQYADPGSFVRERLPNGSSVVAIRDGGVWLEGSGASAQGDRPFLDRMDLATLEKERLFHCGDGCYESVVDVLDFDRPMILTRFETAELPPNYFRADLETGERTALTEFSDPTPQLRGITKELVRYPRADGVELSGTLYLPAGYEQGQRLPLIVWAYPLEYNDPTTAGQVRGSEHRFTRMGGSSHLFFLTQGYAVLDGAAMPVIGDAETMNDTFLDQIVASAQAAIDAMVERGVADRHRVGVGGHSYGAFMTANLLAHCDLFQAGLARSGAYNRTLTPFGFQSERRTLWEAPETYFEISPFMHAHQIQEPILLIHGEKDNNSGTFPIQSERLYHALKGHGAIARLVMLPHESHGYRARESIYHTLAEMVEWFDTYVKGAEPPAGS
jgi:dipeptidyl aminopeptidase/acylaminoacyl peptidase